MAAKSPKSLIILHGEAEVLKRRALRALVSGHVGPESDADAITEFWGKETDLRQIGSTVGAVSLFSDRRVIVLHELHLIPLKEQKPLEAGLGNIPEDTLVVITTRPRPNDRDTRKAPVSAPLLKLGEVKLFTAPRRAEELLPWVVDEFKAAGKHLLPSTANLLLSTVGPDYDRLHNEIEKLILFSGDEVEIMEQAVRECACPAEENTVFELTDAIGARDVPKALSIIRILLPKEATRGSAIPLLGMIARHLRLLWQAAYTIKQQRQLPAVFSEAIKAVFPDDHNLAAEVRSRDWIRRALTSQARNFSEGQLAKAMLKVYEADLALKGFGDEQLDDRMIVETLVISLCRM